MMYLSKLKPIGVPVKKDQEEELSRGSGREADKCGHLL
jgi:hypothetical protein